MKEGSYKASLLDLMLSEIPQEEQGNVERKMLLAAKVYDAMKAKGWDQEEFAREMGKSSSEISKWLSGTHSLTSDTLWVMGDKLEVDLLFVDAQKVEQLQG